MSDNNASPDLSGLGDPETRKAVKKWLEERYPAEAEPEPTTEEAEKLLRFLAEYGDLNQERSITVELDKVHPWYYGGVDFRPDKTLPSDPGREKRVVRSLEGTTVRVREDRRRLGHYLDEGTVTNHNIGRDLVSVRFFKSGKTVDNFRSDELMVLY